MQQVQKQLKRLQKMKVSKTARKQSLWWNVCVLRSERRESWDGLLCRNRITSLVHRIKRWAPCFPAALTVALRQELAGVSEVTIKTPCSPSNTADWQHVLKEERSDRFVYQMKKPSAAWTTLKALTSARQRLWQNVGHDRIKESRFKVRKEWDSQVAGGQKVNREWEKAQLESVKAEWDNIYQMWS